MCGLANLNGFQRVSELICIIAGVVWAVQLFRQLEVRAELNSSLYDIVVSSKKAFTSVRLGVGFSTCTDTTPLGTREDDYSVTSIS